MAPVDRLLAAPAVARTLAARRGVREFALLTVLYLGYTSSRLLADNDLTPALTAARHLLGLERLFDLDWEADLNGWLVDHPIVGVLASFHYATAHYVVTAIAVIWLYRRGAATYGPARTSLVIATLLGLAAYLTVPTAPPRLTGGYVDILRLHEAVGWWGAEASAPRGLGGWTNQLAAFPSLHAGWALWVAVVVWRYSASVPARVLALAHTALTAAVVVATGNHWLLDVLAGWAVVAVGFGLSEWWYRRPTGPAPGVRRRGRWWPTSAAGSPAGTLRSEPSPGAGRAQPPRPGRSWCG